MKIGATVVVAVLGFFTTTCSTACNAPLRACCISFWAAPAARCAPLRTAPAASCAFAPTTWPSCCSAPPSACPSLRKAWRAVFEPLSQATPSSCGEGSGFTACAREFLTPSKEPLAPRRAPSVECSTLPHSWPAAAASWVPASKVLLMAPAVAFLRACVWSAAHELTSPRPKSRRRAAIGGASARDSAGVCHVTKACSCSAGSFSALASLPVQLDLEFAALLINAGSCSSWYWTSPAPSKSAATITVRAHGPASIAPSAAASAALAAAALSKTEASRLEERALPTVATPPEAELPMLTTLCVRTTIATGAWHASASNCISWAATM
mmetsp:Transcript_57012/g.163729  ORF Transcript_57012/g.163729 Transcript_57012/m.163729 type:complete len:325 (+) Transcript_57012:225-1199(+)